VAHPLSTGSASKKLLLPQHIAQCDIFVLSVFLHHKSVFILLYILKCLQFVIHAVEILEHICDSQAILSK